MKTALGIISGLAGGVVGAGVGRASFVFVAGQGWTPDPKKSPRLAGFVADAFLVVGVIPGTLLGQKIGEWVGADPVIKKA